MKAKRSCLILDLSAQQDFELGAKIIESFMNQIRWQRVKREKIKSKNQFISLLEKPYYAIHITGHGWKTGYMNVIKTPSGRVKLTIDEIKEHISISPSNGVILSTACFSGAKGWLRHS